MENKTYDAPGLMSLFAPGMGQIAKGQFLKGSLTMAAFIISAFSVAVLIGWVTTPVIWVWAVYDAYNN